MKAVALRPALVLVRGDGVLAVPRRFDVVRFLADLHAKVLDMADAAHLARVRQAQALDAALEFDDERPITAPFWRDDPAAAVESRGHTARWRYFLSIPDDA